MMEDMGCQHVDNSTGQLDNSTGNYNHLKKKQKKIGYKVAQEVMCLPSK
jgi:hypothetical protein